MKRDSGAAVAADAGSVVASKPTSRPAANSDEDSGTAAIGGNAADSGASAASSRGAAVSSMIESTYCAGATRLLTLPEDPGARGPWAVGARAVKIGSMDAEVWYPARPRSTDGMEKYIYDADALSRRGR